MNRAVAWDTERAATLARKAYRFVASVYPSDAPLELLNFHEDAALKAQAAGDFDAYEDALRSMMRTALEVKTARRVA
jgi:hypothetical protein